MVQKEIQDIKANDMLDRKGFYEWFKIQKEWMRYRKEIKLRGMRYRKNRY